MTENPEKTEPAPPEKLLIDSLSNFQFHAAYVTYSDLFDKAASAETKKQLNESISALQKNEIDFETFYERINQYRSGVSFRPIYSRTMIKTQRKKDWRRKTQKHERIERHK